MTQTEPTLSEQLTAEARNSIESTTGLPLDQVETTVLGLIAGGRHVARSWIALGELHRRARLDYTAAVVGRMPGVNKGDDPIDVIMEAANSTLQPRAALADREYRRDQIATGQLMVIAELLQGGQFSHPDHADIRRVSEAVCVELERRAARNERRARQLAYDAQGINRRATALRTSLHR